MIRAHDITQRSNGPLFSNKCRVITNAHADGVTLTVFIGTTRRVEIELTEAELAGLQEMVAQVQSNFPLATDDDDIIAEMHRQLTEG